jgi:GNAT superfamily N-acetyltransferase
MGTPDVVVMVRDPDGVTGAPKVIGDYSSKKKDIPLVSYDRAVEMQKEAVAKVEKGYKDIKVSQPVKAEDEGKGWNWHYLERSGNPMARMLTSPEPKNRIAVRLLETMPDERGRGYGGKLLERAKEYAKEQGADQLISDPEGGTTEAAGRLWQKVGAEKIPYKGAKDGHVYKVDIEHEEQDTSDLSPIGKHWLSEFKREQKAFEKENPNKLGLRHDADLTGERIAAKDLTNYVKTLGDYQRKNAEGRNIPGVKYGGTADFLMHEGKEFDIPDKPPQVKLMIPRECYSNATKMMLRNPGKYNYAEGYYASSHLPMPIDHAWLVEKKTGMVVDPTLGWQPTARYFGVAYPKQFVVTKMLENEYYGIHSDGNMMNDVVMGKDKDYKYAKRS